MKKTSGPISNNPINNYKWPVSKGRNNGGQPGRPISGSPIGNFPWPNKGRTNK